jgi:hypothetical protein
MSISYRSAPNNAPLNPFVGPKFCVRKHSEPSSIPWNYITLMGIVNRGKRDLLLCDVFPHISLSPIANREYPHVLTRLQGRIVERPRLRPLGVRIPLPCAITEREDPLLRANQLFVAPSTPDERLNTERLSRVINQLNESAHVPWVIRRIERCCYDPLCSRSPKIKHLEIRSKPRRRFLPEPQYLWEISPTIVVDKRKREL